MSQRRRSRATLDPAPSTTPIAERNSSLYRRQDGYVAPTTDERADAAFMDEMLARGYRPSVDCLICGHPLTSKRSLELHVGPKCRAKLAATEAVTDA